MLVPIEHAVLEERVSALLESPYRLLMDEVSAVIATGALSKNQKTRIERLRAKAHHWHEYALQLEGAAQHPSFSYATPDTTSEDLVAHLMKSNCCFLLPVNRQKRLAIAESYREGLGTGTEFIFGSSENTDLYLRAFHVETNRGPACFIDAIEGGVFTWKRVEEWERAGRVHELIAAIASVPSIMRPEEELIVLGEDEASQIASSLGYRKPTIFSNGQKRNVGSEQRAHRLSKPDRSWRVMPRSSLSPISDAERASFSDTVLDYLDTTTCERTAHIVSGAYAQFMRSEHAAGSYTKPAR
jgi:hypothetical protein